MEEKKCNEQIIDRSNLRDGRILWIDVAKGILILLVFWGHIETIGTTVSTIIFSMHMPAFFVLSGYTFQGYRDDFKKFFCHKVKTLLYPYFFFCIIGACVHLLYRHYELFGVEMLKQVFVTAQPDLLYCGAGWFLIVLFFANIYMYVWAKYFEQFDLVFKLISVIMLYYIASNILYVNSSTNIERIPLKLDTSFMAFIFMLVGYYLNKNNVLQKIKNHKLVYALVFFLIYAPVMKINGWCNIANCAYNNYIFYFLESTTGIFLLLLLCIAIANAKIGGG